MGQTVHRVQGGGPSIAEVKAFLRSVLAEAASLDPASIQDESRLDDDIPLSSIAYLEVQVAVEDKFQITIDPVEVAELQTFAQIAKLIAGKARGEGG